MSSRYGSAASSAPQLGELAGRVRPLVLAEERLLPVPAPLAALLPGSGLRRGTTVTVAGSTSLALALVAEASAAGSWVAAVGLPCLGVLAAAGQRIRLERLALVPQPDGRAWTAAVAALLDALDVVLVCPPARPRAADARKLVARARERGAVLVAVGNAWPEPADLRLAVVGGAWQGLGHGHGRLEARRVEVVAGGRGPAAGQRRTWLWLPGPDGAVAPGGPGLEG